MTTQPSSGNQGLAQSETEPVLLRSLQANGVLRLTLNRPQKRNPLSDEMLAALQIALDDTAKDSAVRAIIIGANGSGFCGGHDLKEMTSHRSDADGGRAYYNALFATCSKVMQSIIAHPKVIIAEVQGIATAAGCQLVATCDLAVASNLAQFGGNGINSGLFCSTPMVAMARNIPRKLAMELLTLGNLIDAQQALEAGLVNHVVDHDGLAQAADELAARLAKRPSAVLKLGKEAFYKQLEMPIEEAYAYTSKVIVDNMLMDDAAEGIDAFLTKREPKWKS